MIVALESGLEHLKEFLETKGHVIVPLYGEQRAVDAVIYERESMAELTLSLQNYAGLEGGIFMVCARGLSPAQVADALTYKTNDGTGIF